MNLWQRFKRLSLWNKVGVLGGFCSILGFLGWLLLRSPQSSVEVNLTAVNSPNTTQIITEKVTIELSPQLKPKLTVAPVYVNRLENDRYVTLLHCKLEALYPIPRLRAEAYSPTVEEIELCPLGAAVYVSGPTGKDEGRVFTTLQNATGNLKLKVITRESSKLHINFSVQ